jgi:hypothetical protein
VLTQPRHNDGGIKTSRVCEDDGFHTVSIEAK